MGSVGEVDFPHELVQRSVHKLFQFAVAVAIIFSELLLLFYIIEYNDE